MTIIFTDTREKARAIKKIICEFQSQDIKYFPTKLFVGDYMCPENPLTFIDRKQNIAEIAQNAGKGHDRFKKELVRLTDIGGKMFILVEQDKIDGKKIMGIEDIILWENKHGAMTGDRVYRILKGWENSHNIEYIFCSKRNTGKRIIELLRGD